MEIWSMTIKYKKVYLIRYFIVFFEFKPTLLGDICTVIYVQRNNTMLTVNCCF